MNQSLIPDGFTWTEEARETVFLLSDNQNEDARELARALLVEYLHFCYHLPKFFMDYVQFMKPEDE